jgi:hypothetical protein
MNEFFPNFKDNKECIKIKRNLKILIVLYAIMCIIKTVIFYDNDFLNHFITFIFIFFTINKKSFFMAIFTFLFLFSEFIFQLFDFLLLLQIYYFNIYIPDIYQISFYSFFLIIYIFLIQWIFYAYKEFKAIYIENLKDNNSQLEDINSNNDNIQNSNSNNIKYKAFSGKGYKWGDA